MLKALNLPKTNANFVQEVVVSVLKKVVIHVWMDTNWNLQKEEGNKFSSVHKNAIIHARCVKVQYVQVVNRDSNYQINNASQILLVMIHAIIVSQALSKTLMDNAKFVKSINAQTATPQANASNVLMVFISMRQGISV